MDLKAGDAVETGTPGGKDYDRGKVVAVHLEAHHARTGVNLPKRRRAGNNGDRPKHRAAQDQAMVQWEKGGLTTVPLSAVRPAK